MSSKTKIVVLHMKELIYTAVFAVLGIALVILLLILFLPDDQAHTPGGSQTSPAPDSSTDDSTGMTASLYIPGLYNTQLYLSDQAVNVEVIVNGESITSLSLADLDESVATMYPLLEPTFDTLAAQILETQSLENISYDSDSRYTSLVLLEAISKALEKAQP